MLNFNFKIQHQCILGKTDFAFNFWPNFKETHSKNVDAMATRKSLSNNFLYIVRKVTKFLEKKAPWPTIDSLIESNSSNLSSDPCTNFLDYKVITPAEE